MDFVWFTNIQPGGFGLAWRLHRKFWKARSIDEP